jgi:hypothetical protein
VFRVEVTPGHMVMRITPKGHPEEIGFEEDFSTFKDRFQAGELTARRLNPIKGIAYLLWGMPHLGGGPDACHMRHAMARHRPEAGQR